MYKFFSKHKPYSGENISEERLSAIKSSVLSQVNQEELTMKKRFIIKPLIIAAVVATAAAVTTIGTVAAVQPKIVEIDGKKWEVYQQNEYTEGDYRYVTGVAKCLEEVPAPPRPDDSEFTLVNTEEYTEGDYRYVTKLYKAE